MSLFSSANTINDIIVLPPNPIIKFNITPLSYSQPPFCNIFRIQSIGSTSDKCSNGCRIPFVGFNALGTTSLFIRFDSPYDGADQGFDGSETELMTLIPGVSTNVGISVSGSEATISINGVNVASRILSGFDYGSGLGILWKSDAFFNSCNASLSNISISESPQIESQLLNSIETATNMGNITLPTNMLVNFKLHVLNATKAAYCSIFRITKNFRDCCDLGDRILHVYMVPGKSQLFVWIDSGRWGSWQFVSEQIGTLIIGKTYNVSIMVNGNNLTLSLNGNITSNTVPFTENRKPWSGNFAYWQSDQFYPPCGAKISGVSFGTTTTGTEPIKNNPASIITVPRNPIFSFSLFPNSYVQPPFCNIFRAQYIGIKEDKCNYGCRMPLVGFRDATKVYVRFDSKTTNDSGIFGNESTILSLPSGVWSNILIIVKDTKLSVFVNQVFAVATELPAVPFVGVAALWTSDPYFEACNVKLSAVTVQSHESNSYPAPFAPLSDPTFTETWNSTSTRWGKSPLTPNWGNKLIKTNDPYTYGINLNKNSGAGMWHPYLSRTGLLCAVINTPHAFGTTFALYTTSNGSNPITGWDEYDFEWVCSAYHGVSTNYITGGEGHTTEPELSSDGSNWTNNHTYCLYWDMNVTRTGTVLWLMDGQVFRGEVGYHGMTNSTPQQAVVSYWSSTYNYPGSCDPGSWMGEYGGANITTWVSNLTYTIWD